MAILEDPFRLLNSENLSIGEHQQKYFTEANGILHTNYKDEMCRCGHKQSKDLDRYDLCLSVTGSLADTTCLCDGFRDIIHKVNDELGNIKKSTVKLQEDWRYNRLFARSL